MVSNCKKGFTQDNLIVLTMTQTQWGLNYCSSMGHVEVFLQGGSADGIILSSIEIKGDNSSAAPLKPESAEFVAGNKFRALFEKNRVIGLLLNPEEGSTHIIIVSFLLIDGTERFELTAKITIEEDEDNKEGQPSNLKLELSPPDWNMNFYTETDIVTAKIRGKGLEYIDLGSLEMEGDNSSATPLKGAQGVLEGDHVKTHFPKNKVLDLLLNPAEGTAHTVTVTFLVKGGNQRMGVSTVVHVQ
jgi:hypothetical protein